MPRGSGGGAGSVYGQRATASTVGEFTMGESTYLTRPLMCEGMPYLNVWMVQDEPLVAGSGATVEMQVAWRANKTAGSDDLKTFKLEWQTVATFVLAPGVVSVPFAPTGFLMPASFVRLAVAADSDFDFPTLRYTLACNA